MQVSYSDLQKEHRLIQFSWSLKSILFTKTILFTILYWETLNFVSTVTIHDKLTSSQNENYEISFTVQLRSFLYFSEICIWYSSLLRNMGEIWSMRYEGIIFHSWKFWSDNLFIREYCRLITFVNMSISFKQPSSWLFKNVKCFIFGFLLLHIKFFSILLHW